MADPIDFLQSNDIIRGGETGAGDIKVLRVNMLNSNNEACPVIITRWKFSPEEQEAIINNDGEFSLIVWGQFHPPVSIEGNLEL